MVDYLEYVDEPSKLLLAWQAPDQMNNRRRWAVAVVAAFPTGWTLRYLNPTEFAELNPGMSLEDAKQLGYRGYPAFRLKKRLHTEGVRQAFLRRLPPTTRPDFDAYIGGFGFRQGQRPSDLSLLAYTEAKLPSDGFSLVNPLDREKEFVDLVLDVAGTRHLTGWSAVAPKVGDSIEFRPEPTNEHDRNAIEVVTSGRRLGYINRLQAQTFGYWLQSRQVRARIRRVNGQPGSPKVYIFVQVRPRTTAIAA